MKTKILGLLAASAFAIPAGVNAAPINGSITISGVFVDSTIPSAGTSIVSQLMSVASPLAVAGGSSGDYLASNGVLTSVGTIDLGSGAPGAQPLYTFADGTVFSAQQLTNLVRTPLACSNGNCSDALGFLLIGVVTRAGFDATPATVNWLAQASCQGGGNPATCTNTASATWAAFLVSPITTAVPEPGTLALLGLGLAGLGLNRRRKA